MSPVTGKGLALVAAILFSQPTAAQVDAAGRAEKPWTSNPKVDRTAKTKQPGVDIPAQFALQEQPSSAPNAAWWTIFGDADLTALVQIAMRNNRDLAVAKQRIVEAQIAVRVAGQDRLPQLQLGLGYTQSTRSNNSPAIPQLSEANRPAGFPDLIPRRYGVAEGSAELSYTLDPFGTKRDAIRAAEWDATAQTEDLHDTVQLVATETANHYWVLREAQVRLLVAKRTEQNLVDALALTNMRIGAGLSDESSRLGLEGQLAEKQAAIATLGATVEQEIFSLATLTGQPRTALLYLADFDRELPALLQPVPSGLPSELLQRRPEIRRATAQWQAAIARRRAAEREWFPRFQLTSNGGGQSGELTNLLAAGSLFSNLTPKLTWGVLQFQQTKANIRRQAAREAQELARLEAAILAALRDVDSALSSLHRDRHQLLALQQIVAIRQKEAQFARDRFRAGLTNYLPVLAAERAELAAAEEIAQARGALAKSVVTLQKALGGGWQATPAAQ